MKPRWIDLTGVWQWNPYKDGTPIEGSNVPAFVWTAGCCLFRFPDHGNEQFAVRVAYYMANTPGATGKYTSLIKRLRLFISSLF